MTAALKTLTSPPQNWPKSSERGKCEKLSQAGKVYRAHDNQMWCPGWDPETGKGH